MAMVGAGPEARTGGGETVAVIARDFATNQLAWQRLWRRDEEFRAICEDYDAAHAALILCRSAGPAHVARAEEYSALVDELRSEILERLHGGSAAGRR